VLYDERNNRFHLLNPSANIVWSCLDGTVSLDALSDELAEAFDTPVEVVRVDLMGLVTRFAGEGLLEGISASSGVETVNGGSAESLHYEDVKDG
jgi:hypothetical protein